MYYKTLGSDFIRNNAGTVVLLVYCSLAGPERSSRLGTQMAGPILEPADTPSEAIGRLLPDVDVRSRTGYKKTDVPARARFCRLRPFPNVLVV